MFRVDLPAQMDTWWLRRFAPWRSASRKIKLCTRPKIMRHSLRTLLIRLVRGSETYSLFKWSNTSSRIASQSNQLMISSWRTLTVKSNCLQLIQLHTTLFHFYPDKVRLNPQIQNFSQTKRSSQTLKPQNPKTPWWQSLTELTIF